ncbi:MAG: type II/IV secretion system ATPase subunit [Thaumarchaeota archaeon]|nr:type II/IV secretion system ATPase subunit [Nitrososphaerota archaeon]
MSLLQQRFKQSLRNAFKNNPHLLRYVDEWARAGRPIPEYLEQLSRDLRYQKRVNIIYPVGDPIFIHVYSRRPDQRPMYVVIQPAGREKLGRLLDLVDELIIDLVDEELEFRSPEDQEKILKGLLKKVVELRPGMRLGDYELTGKRTSRKLVVGYETYKVLEYNLILEKVRLGPLEPFIRDPYIEDVSCDGIGPIFVEHKVFGSCETNLRFDSEDELDRFIRRLSERCGRPVTFRNPIVDASLPDGSRINIVYGSELSMRGSNFTIRKFASKPLSITQLISFGSIGARIAAYLWLLLEHNMSVWFCGEVASGKTTLLRACCTFINPHYKIVSIEDTPEIIVPHDNWIREVTRESEEEATIGLFDLLKAALRQRPNYIIVGEIRGREASVAFQAMQTGAPVLATFHAGSISKLVQRLTGSPIEIPKTYIDVLNCVVIQSAVRFPRTGTFERRVLSVNEIMGYDPIEEKFSYIELFSWQPAEDAHEFRGEGSSHLLENRIAVMKGLPRSELKKIYWELELRASFLSKLVEHRVFDYNLVWKMIKQAYNLGIGHVLEQIEEGGKPWKSD